MNSSCHCRRYIKKIILFCMTCTLFAFHSSISKSRPDTHSQRTLDVLRSPGISTATHAQTRSSNPNNRISDTSIQNVLRKNGFGKRLITLSNLNNQPMPAELYENSSWKLCLIVGIKAVDDAKKPPLLEIQVLNDDWSEKVVDIGQITTIWHDFYQSYSIGPASLHDALQSSFSSARAALQSSIFPVEKCMQNLYNNRIANRNNQRSGSLSKKQIPKIAAKSSDPVHTEELLRNLIKVGEDRVSRLVDASMANDYLYNDFTTGNEGITRRIVAATVLTEDAVTGGRFKRRSCQFVETGSNDVEQATLVNGGWIAVDPSIKSTTEGRKFASLAEGSPSNSNESTNKNKPRVFTSADERVSQRLECLAMGDVWKDDKMNGEEQRLELDVREALTQMKLPLTPDGARFALIKIGRWTECDGKKNSRIEPWSSEVLEAARALAAYENDRRTTLSKVCFTKNKSDVEGRIDLSALPCVCVDAQRATFRDDSIGLRMRSSTGRKVNKAASKWEVLIHIADVSDLYFTEDKRTNNVMIPKAKGLDMDLLRGAAERRGQSRYDLPLGPLHLLPPVALEALALSTNQNKVPNRCVTIWAYIDERDGKLLEAGLERTIISSPIALSFADATMLLDCNMEDTPKKLSNAKAILSAAERNLSLWSNRHKQMNKAAQQRESRLATREMIAATTNGSVNRDDGAKGSFQRSRGHRLVDSALDLYGFATATLMKRANQPVPRAAGSGADRAGRLGTAPLRRYIDGLAQRQALSALCNYGVPLTLDECKAAAKMATEASNEITNIRSSKATNGRKKTTNNTYSNQISALHKLNRHLTSTGGINGERKVRAISTGRNNEIVIEGVGATARLKGVSSLKGGKKMTVQVVNIDPELGILDVTLA